MTNCLNMDTVETHYGHEEKGDPEQLHSTQTLAGDKESIQTQLIISFNNTQTTSNGKSTGKLSTKQKKKKPIRATSNYNPIIKRRKPEGT